MFKKYDAHIVGYYGMQNSGDDALMHATAWGAKNLLQKQSTSLGLYSFANQSVPVTRQYQLKYNQKFPGQNRLTQYKAALQSKAIIFGGGSVLHSESDINFKRHLMTLAGARQSRAMGVGIGPFQSIAAEKSCADFLNECGFVGVRDQISFDIAKSLAPNAKVKKTFDLAPLLLCAKPQKIASAPRTGIALSLCSVAINPMGKIDHNAERKRIDDFCQLISKVYKHTGQAITLIEFNGHAALGDWQINNAIVTRLQKKIPIMVKKYNPDPFAVMADLASYKAIISMRLHGSILAYLANTPVLSINYHSKCQGWCQQIGLAENYQFNLQNFDVEGLKKELEQGLNTGFVSPSLAVSRALESALSNWSISHEQAKFYSNYSAI
jgi:polysaccharide pyruvyl transferase WcaK-like protein